MQERRLDPARALLRSVRAARADRLHCESRLERLRTEAERITASYSLAGNVGSGDVHKDALLAELADRGEELDRKIRALWAREKLVEEFIALVPDDRHRAVLRLRYLDCLSWPRVLAALPALGYWYDERQVFRLHGAGLQAARERYGDFVRKHPELKQEETE